ncbi:MAG: desulfoferrodoxin [Syntrophaceae bacterium]
MTERYQVYKCDSCGNIVEMLHSGQGQMICCGKTMRKLTENTVDASLEKHVPVVSNAGDDVVVKVGSVAHPMEKEHYIEWIEAIKDGNTIFRQYLNPGDAPEAKFKTDMKGLMVREFCNLHGLWKA